MFSLSIAGFGVHYPLTASYWLANINEQYFNRFYPTLDTSFDGTTSIVLEQFMGISKVADINEYMTEFFRLNFLSADVSESPNFLNDKKILYGPYRIHTVNVEKGACLRGVDISAYNGTQNGIDYNIECLKYEPSLSGSISKENITGTSAGTFRSASSAKLDYTLSGEYHKFNGDGYIWDIYPTELNQSSFLTQYNELVDAGFIGGQTVGVIISFIVYSKDLDMWTYDVAYLEKNLQGVIYTHLPYSQVFEPNKFETNTEKFFLAVD